MLLLVKYTGPTASKIFVGKTNTAQEKQQYMITAHG